jgi:hypothetical protein
LQGEVQDYMEQNNILKGKNQVLETKLNDLEEAFEHEIKNNRVVL